PAGRRSTSAPIGALHFTRYDERHVRGATTMTRVALITGGTRGIGKAIAMRFARDGCDVAVNYSRSKDDAGATVGELRAFGVRGEALQCDVGDRDAVFAMVQTAADRFGRIDVLVNSAARGLERPRAA